MPFDYSKLKGRIVEVFNTQEAFAVAMGISTKALSQKMTGKRPWKQAEMQLAMLLLKESEDKIPQYFFTSKVQYIEQNKTMRILNI